MLAEGNSALPHFRATARTAGISFDQYSAKSLHSAEHSLATHICRKGPQIARVSRVAREFPLRVVAVVTRAIDVCISQRGGDPQGDITNAPDDVKDIEARRAAEDKHDIGPSTVEQKDQSKPGSAALSCRYCNKSYVYRAFLNKHEASCNRKPPRAT